MAVDDLNTSIQGINSHITDLLHRQNPGLSRMVESHLVYDWN